MLVSQNLNFDMTRVFQEFLHVNRAVTKGSACFLSGQLQSINQMCFGVDNAHPSAATAGRCLDNDRIANIPGDFHTNLRIICEWPVRTGNTGHPCFFHCCNGRNLVTHQTNGFRSGPDENKPALLNPLCKISVLGQETVSGMNRDRISDFGCRDNRRNVQIAFCSGCRPDAYRLISHGNMFKVSVYCAVHSHSLDTHRLTGAQYPERNFATVGDDNFVKNSHILGPPALSDYE